MGIFRRIAAVIPGTQSSRERIESEVKKQVETTIIIHDSVAQFVTEPERQHLKDAIQKAREKIVRYDIKRSLYEDFYANVVMWVSILVFIVAGLNGVLHLADVASPWRSGTIGFLFLLAGSLLLFGPVLILLARGTAGNWLFGFLTCIAWPIGCLWTLRHYIERISPLIRLESTAAHFILTLLLVLVAGFECLVMGVIIAITGRDAIKHRRSPDASLVSLLYELSTLDFVAIMKEGVKSQMDIVIDLEVVAELLEKRLYRSLRRGDPNTDQRLLSTLQEMSETQRNLGRQMLLPTLETTKAVDSSVGQALVFAAAGRWGELPRTPRVPLTRVQRYQIAIEGLRSLLIAMLPILGLWVLPRFGLNIAETARGYLAGAAYLWAVVAIALTLDPALNKKIDTFQAVITSVKSFGSKG